MLDMFGNGPNGEFVKMKTLSGGNDTLLEQPCLWNALSELNADLLLHGFSKIGLVGAFLFDNDPMYDSIRYSGFDYVVYPTDPHLYVDTSHWSSRIKAIETIAYASDVVIGTQPAVTSVNEQAVVGDGFIYPVAVDDSYVLSTHFYAKDSRMSTLESLIWDYLDSKSIDPTQLLQLYRVSHQWGQLEQYYYWPLLLMLMQSVLVAR
jgi:hypothetical protein